MAFVLVVFSKNEVNNEIPKVAFADSAESGDRWSNVSAL